MALLRYEELTYKIIGCAMSVHKAQGNGFQEVIYQRCLALEFERNSILFEREREMPIFYHGIEVGTRRADFLVEYKVIVETKAVIQLDEIDLAQALNYLEVLVVQKEGKRSISRKLKFYNLDVIISVGYRQIGPL